MALQQLIYEKLTANHMILPEKLMNLQSLIPDLFLAYSKPDYAAMIFKKLASYVHFITYQKRPLINNISSLIPSHQDEKGRPDLLVSSYRKILAGMARALMEAKNYDEAHSLVSHLDSRNAINKYTLAGIHLKFSKRLDLKRGLRLLSKSAKAGVMQAQLALGKIYLRGLYGEKTNHLKAYLWLKAALAAIEDPSIRYIEIGFTDTPPNLKNKLKTTINKLGKKLKPASLKKADNYLAKMKSHLRKKSEKRIEKYTERLAVAEEQAFKLRDRANKRIILAALEMYNLDFGTDLIISSNLDLKKLIKDSYLEGPLLVPGCKSHHHYFADSVGNVWSLKYGSADGVVIPGGVLTEKLAKGTGKCNDDKLVAKIRAELSR